MGSVVATGRPLVAAPFPQRASGRLKWGGPGQEPTHPKRQTAGPSPTPPHSSRRTTPPQRTGEKGQQTRRRPFAPVLVVVRINKERRGFPRRRRKSSPPHSDRRSNASKPGRRPGLIRTMAHAPQKGGWVDGRLGSIDRRPWGGVECCSSATQRRTSVVCCESPSSSERAAGRG